MKDGDELQQLWLSEPLERSSTGGYPMFASLDDRMIMNRIADDGTDAARWIGALAFLSLIWGALQDVIRAGGSLEFAGHAVILLAALAALVQELRTNRRISEPDKTGTLAEYRQELLDRYRERQRGEWRSVIWFLCAMTVGIALVWAPRIALQAQAGRLDGAAFGEVVFYAAGLVLGFLYIRQRRRRIREVLDRLAEEGAATPRILG